MQELCVESGIGEGWRQQLGPRWKTPSGELEIYSWWAGDEGPALEALIELYGEMYPDVEVINATVAGGSGTEAKAVLKTRMLGGDPPDTFQVHAGQELIGTWVVADRMEDLTALFEEEGWMDKVPAGSARPAEHRRRHLVGPGEHPPLERTVVHPDNLEGWGVDVPATWDDFLAICPTLQDQGVIPLALATELDAQPPVGGCGGSRAGSRWLECLWTGEKNLTDPDVRPPGSCSDRSWTAPTRTPPPCPGSRPPTWSSAAMRPLTRWATGP